MNVALTCQRHVHQSQWVMESSHLAIIHTQQVLTNAESSLIIWNGFDVTAIGLFQVSKSFMNLRQIQLQFVRRSVCRLYHGLHNVTSCFQVFPGNLRIFRFFSFVGTSTIISIIHGSNVGRLFHRIQERRSVQIIQRSHGFMDEAISSPKREVIRAISCPIVSRQVSKSPSWRRVFANKNVFDDCVFVYVNSSSLEGTGGSLRVAGGEGGSLRVTGASSDAVCVLSVGAALLLEGVAVSNSLLPFLAESFVPEAWFGDNWEGAAMIECVVTIECENVSKQCSSLARRVLCRCVMRLFWTRRENGALTSA